MVQLKICPQRLRWWPKIDEHLECRRALDPAVDADKGVRVDRPIFSRLSQGHTFKRVRTTRESPQTHSYMPLFSCATSAENTNTVETTD